MPVLWRRGDDRNIHESDDSRMPRLRADGEKRCEKMAGISIFILFGLIMLYAREVEKNDD